MQATAAEEDAAWESERSNLHERLQHLQARQQESKKQLHAMLDKRSQLDLCSVGCG